MKQVSTEKFVIVETRTVHKYKVARVPVNLVRDAVEVGSRAGLSNTHTYTNAGSLATIFGSQCQLSSHC